MILNFPSKIELLEKHLKTMGVDHMHHSIIKEYGHLDFISMAGTYKTCRIQSTGITLEEAFEKLILSAKKCDEVEEMLLK